MNATRLRNLQILLAMVLAGGSSSLQASDWRVGDVFVGIGNGQYKVFDKDGNFKETISDGQGLTGGCAFDSTYHLVTTNISNAEVLRYKIDHPHGILQATPTSGAGSVVFAGNGDFYVGSPGSPNGDGFIRKYDHAGKLLATYPVQVENSGSNWIDLTADEKTIFYTSEGRLIKRFGVLNGQLDDFVNLGNPADPNFRLFALRLLRGGLLVADKGNIKRLDSLGNVVATYDAESEDDWRSLNLDPLNLDPNPSSFWAGDATSGKFYRFNIETGTVEVGPVNTQSESLSGICVNGAFSAAQGSPRLIPRMVTSANPSAAFPLDGSELTVTLNGLRRNMNVSLTARASFIHKDAGFSDNGMPCTLTAANGQCIIWNIEATPESGFSTADLKIFQPNSGMNTRVLKNEATDITTFVRSIDPGGTVDDFSVFSLNQASGNALSCGYQRPVAEGSVHNQGSTIPFKFKAKFNAAADCEKGPFLMNLRPRLSLVRLVEGGAPHPFKAEVAGGSGSPPVYRLEGEDYLLNLMTDNLPRGDYLATTFDDSGQISAFEVLFTLR
jgi:hypothetical protein